MEEEYYKNDPEGLMWATITESAKKKFDYDSFARHFPPEEKTTDTFPELVVFMAIQRFAYGLSEREAALEILKDMHDWEVELDYDFLREFVKGKKKLFKRESVAQKIVNEMFDNDVDITIIHSTLLQLLQ